MDLSETKKTYRCCARKRRTTSYSAATYKVNTLQLRDDGWRFLTNLDSKQIKQRNEVERTSSIRIYRSIVFAAPCIVKSTQKFEFAVHKELITKK